MKEALTLLLVLTIATSCAITNNSKNQTALTEPQNLQTTQEIERVTPEGSFFGTLNGFQNNKGKTLVIFHSGSGPTDRDGNSPLLGGKSNYIQMLADSLHDAGIASLRYDKRGIFKSAKVKSDLATMTIEHFVEDLIGMKNFAQNELGFKNVIYAGHSLGSLVCALAAKKNEVAGFVSISGMGKSMTEVLRKQLLILPEAMHERTFEILDSVGAGHQVKNVPVMLFSVFAPQQQHYLHSIMRHNPMDVIGALTCPKLIISGGRDIQVDESEFAMLIESSPTAQQFFGDEMNHVLRAAPEERGANIKTYMDPTLPLYPGLAQSMIKFCRGK